MTEARRRHRRLGLLAFGALVGLALASALAVFAFSQRSDAQEQARVAKAGQLIGSSLSLLDSDPELGLAFALEGATLDPTLRAEEALRLSLRDSRQRAIYDIGRPLVGLDVSRSGSNAVVVGTDGVARMLDLETATSSGRRASTGRRPRSGRGTGRCSRSPLHAPHAPRRHRQAPSPGRRGSHTPVRRSGLRSAAADAR